MPAEGLTPTQMAIYAGAELPEGAGGIGAARARAPARGACTRLLREHASELEEGSEEWRLYRELEAEEYDHVATISTEMERLRAEARDALSHRGSRATGVGERGAAPRRLGRAPPAAPRRRAGDHRALCRSTPHPTLRRRRPRSSRLRPPSPRPRPRHRARRRPARAARATAAGSDAARPEPSLHRTDVGAVHVPAVVDPRQRDPDVEQRIGRGERVVSSAAASKVGSLWKPCGS